MASIRRNLKAQLAILCALLAPAVHALSPSECIEIARKLERKHPPRHTVAEGSTHNIRNAITEEFEILSQQKGIDLEVLETAAAKLTTSPSLRFRTSKAREFAYPTAPQAIELVYIATTRGLDLDYIQVKLAEYRFQSTQGGTAINSVDDLIERLAADPGLGAPIERPIFGRRP